METDIGPIEGMSGRGSITFRSGKFAVTAKRKKGAIEYKVKRTSRLARFLYKHPNFPGLRTVRFDLKILSMMERWHAVLLIIVLVSLSFAMAYQDISNPGSMEKVDSFMDEDSWKLYIVLMPFFLVLVHRRRAWHAAEQMAIQAGTDDMYIIAQRDRVYGKSPERFLAPFLAGGIISLAVATLLQIDPTIPSFVIAETILWADAIIGLDNIRITAKASELIQRRLTTSPPGKEELETAQTAIRELIRAHNIVGF